MATYPKVIRPWRGYPSANVTHCIRAHVKQVGAEPGLGQFALTRDVARHIGTIPKGAIILPSFFHRITPFTAAVTIVVGPNPTTLPALGAKDGILTSAVIAPQTAAAFVAGTVGALTGFTANDMPLYILAEAAAPAAGELDVVIPFYINRD